MRIVIDREKCLGNGLCSMTAPHLFGLDDEVVAEALVGSIDGESDAALAREAARLCPTQAITLET